jgi:hypothetical protein
MKERWRTKAQVGWDIRDGDDRPGHGMFHPGGAIAPIIPGFCRNRGAAEVPDR